MVSGHSIGADEIGSLSSSTGLVVEERRGFAAAFEILCLEDGDGEESSSSLGAEVPWYGITDVSGRKRRCSKGKYDEDWQ